MARRQLTLENEVAAELAGSEDTVLRELEERIGCNVFLRGNVLTLDGDEGDDGGAGTSCDGLADAYCDRIQSCAPGLLGIFFGDHATCVERAQLSCELDRRYKCYGADSTEDWLRRHGLGVIHGGTNSLRYTPWFLMTEPEVELVIELTRRALVEGPGAA